MKSALRAGAAAEGRKSARDLALFGSRLARGLAFLALRRAAAWLACSIAFLSLGTGAAALLGAGAAAQTGLALVAVSALPIALLWPPPAGLMKRRFRGLDADTSVEAFLESPPGPARELLAGRVARRAADLAYAPPPRERPFRGLGPYFLAAAAAFAALELGSLIVLRRPMLVYAGREAAPGGGARTEEADFAPFGEADPAALSETGQGAGSESREEETALEGGIARDEAAEGGLGRRPARRRDGSLPDLPPGEGAGPAESSEARGGQDASAEGEGVPSGEYAAGEGQDDSSGRQGGAAERGEARRGRGFEGSGDTRVASPLVDYRARIDSVYAERTGERSSASGDLALGELREFQKRFFASFALRAGIDRSEDPEAALLKKRWRGLREGLE